LRKKAAYRLSSSFFIKQNHVFHPELIDSKVQSSEIIIREKEGFRVCYGQDSYQSWSQSTFGYVGCCYYRIQEEYRNPQNEHIKRTKNMFMVTEHFLSNVVEEYGEHPV
jgi:hypothetical protein